MTSEAVEHRGTEPKAQSDIVREVSEAINRSSTLIDVQKERLLHDLQPAFDRLNQYARLYQGFVSDVRTAAEHEDFHAEVVDESFRRVLGLSVDDLSNMDRLRLNEALADFGQCVISRKIGDLVDDFRIKVDELEIG